MKQNHPLRPAVPPQGPFQHSAGSQEASHPSDWHKDRFVVSTYSLTWVGEILQDKSAIHPKQAYLEPMGEIGDICQAGTSHSREVWQTETQPGAVLMPLRERLSLLLPAVLWTSESLQF